MNPLNIDKRKARGKIGGSAEPSRRGVMDDG